jgi:hypothetical protein
MENIRRNNIKQVVGGNPATVPLEDLDARYGQVPYY